MNSLKGLATGIGSLPHKDAQEAVNLILKSLPEAPFWPQLPKRDMREGMLLQFTENLPCLKLKDKGVYFDSTDRDVELEKFYEKVIAQDLEYFKISSEFSQGLHEFHQQLEKIDLSAIKFIKCQVTGPFTFASGISDSQGVSILHDETLMQAMTAGLSMKAAWQINYFKSFGKPLIMFFDEPYLSAVGSAYTPVNRDRVIEVFNGLLSTIAAPDCLTAIHCCGNTDWSMLTDIDALNIINFDAFDFQDRFILYAQDIKKFIQRGGAICWGVVPTQKVKSGCDAKFLADKIKSGINSLVAKGLDRDLLMERSFISPACGLGTLPVEDAEEIFALLNKIFDKVM